METSHSTMKLAQHNKKQATNLMTLAQHNKKQATI